jgi:sulfite reductase (NADPH) flavoprotein alpha-component
MTMLVNPPAVTPIIPETAPFTSEQRAWLNGFFAGLMAPNPGVTPVAAEMAGLLPPSIQAPAMQAPAAPDDDDAPWHDASLPLPERLKLADGRRLELRMMAAMAQQDCGQCGFNCRDYAKAITIGTEARLNLCVPGGKDTARTLKSLIDEAASKVAPKVPEPKQIVRHANVAVRPGTSREHPVEVTFLSRQKLNKDGSEKATYHVEFDLSESGLEYAVGDSFGIYAENDPVLVDAVIEAVHAPADFPIAGRPLREVLLHDLSLGGAPDALFELISFITGGERRQKAKCIAKGEDPDGDAATLDVLAALEKFPGIRPDPEAFVESLEPLQPRLYSISSSPKRDPGRLTLTVDHVFYSIGERMRHGLASSWLSLRAKPGSKLKAYVQKAHNFALPAHRETPIIMVGPGTGIAPFRAFLQERMVTEAKGSAWLFFGHQRRATDFFYESELQELIGKGTLSKLSLAWSRDGESKTYVQDKMRVESRELWHWLSEGAHFYICGDAKRMAVDVEKTLLEIIARHGARDEAAARAFLQEMKACGRYQADVY